MGRLVATCGETQTFDDSLFLTKFFPTPENILAADLSQIGLTYAKIQALKTLSQEVANKTIVLDGTADLEETSRKLSAIKGIGPGQSNTLLCGP